MQSKLSDPLDGGGYMASDAHFEIGKNLHVNNFYYAKKYLQNTKNTDRLAAQLAAEIKAISGKLKEVTLVGYGNYSALCLSKTVKILDPTGVAGVNYAIIAWDSSEYSFSFSPDLKADIIVVLPITCTFSRYFRIREFISAQYPEHKLRDHFFSIIVILHPHICKQFSEIENNQPLDLYRQPADIRELYKPFNWCSISKRQVVFNNGNANDQQCGPVAATFLEYYRAEIFPAEKCHFCFPLSEGVGAKNADALKERPLIQPLPNDSLNIIFELPKFAPEEIAQEERQFQEVFRANAAEPVHLYGHLELHNNSYLNYIRRDVFYLQNREDILRYFEAKLEEFREQHQNEDIVIITPGHFYTSTFIEDLIEFKILGNNHITIIPYEPFDEFLENFIHDYKGIVKNAQTLVYIDEIVAGGKTFKLISDYLKNARLNTGSEPDELTRGFDYFLTLIDRSTLYAKEEIKRKLATKTKTQTDGSFISYFKLNVPQIDHTHIGNPIIEREQTLRQVYNESHLDALKLFVGNEIYKGIKKSVPQLKAEYKRDGNLKYFPFVNSPERFRFYKDKYTFSQRNLLKLQLFHYISSWLSGKTEFDEADREELFNFLLAEDKLNIYFRIPASEVSNPLRDTSMEKELIKELLLKILSRPPFRFYKSIYDTIFKYNNKQLYERLEALSQAGDEVRTGGKVHFAKIGFEDFRKLRMYIKRSIDLNANFILSDYFLLQLKQYFVHEAAIFKIYERQRISIIHEDPDFAKRQRANLKFQGHQVITFKYFLLYCYKELIFKNPARSIVLEKLLNQNKLIPQGLERASGDLPDGSLRRLFSDSFYHLKRILLAENNYFLNEFIREQLQHDHFARSIIKGDAGDWKPTGFGPVELEDLLIDLYSPGADETQEIAREYKYFLTLAEKDDKLFGRLKDIIKAGGESQQLIYSIKERLIHRYYFYRYFNNAADESGSSSQLRTFLSVSEAGRMQLVNEQIRTSVRSMLFTLSLINNYKSALQQSPLEGADHFTREIKRILAAATKIIGNNLEYAFFVEYRERKGQDDIDNIFGVTSMEDGENKNIRLHPEGLLYQTLYGLQDYENGNIQTFLAIAKMEDGRIFSLKDKYFTIPEYRPGQPSNVDAAKEVNVTQALPLDYRSDTYGSLTIEKAGMILLFRLAITKQHDPQSPFSTLGQAVFAICSPEVPTVASFTDFASMEKMRLLLLIKEQLLAYLQKQFDSDAFISVLDDRKIADFRKDLNHGIYNYMLALREYHGALLKDTEYQPGQAETYPAQRIRLNAIMADTVINAIIGQIHSVNAAMLQEIPVVERLFREKIDALFEDADLGNKSINRSKVSITGTIPQVLPYGIYQVVLPELVINMKKYCPDRGEKALAIVFAADYITFRNKIGIIPELAKEKQHGGLAMCNNILAHIGLPELQGDTEDVHNGYFMITLNLTQPNKSL